MPGGCCSVLPRGDFLTILQFQKCCRMTIADLLLTPGEGSISQAQWAGHKAGAALCSLFPYRTSLAPITSELEHNPGEGAGLVALAFFPAKGKGQKGRRRATLDCGVPVLATGGSSAAPPRPCGSGRWLPGMSLCFLFPEVRTHTPPSETVDSKGDRGDKGRHTVPSTWQAPPHGSSHCHTHCDLARGSDELVSGRAGAPAKVLGFSNPRCLCSQRPTLSRPTGGSGHVSLASDFILEASLGTTSTLL